MSSSEDKKIKHPRHINPDCLFENSKNNADNEILEAADEFLKLYNIDSSNTIGVQSIKDICEKEYMDKDSDVNVNQTIQLYQVIQKLTRAQEAAKSIELERLKVLEEYSTNTKKLLEVDTSKLERLTTIENILSSLVNDSTIRVALNKLAENQQAISNQLFRIITLLDTILHIIQLSSYNNIKAAQLLEESNKQMDIALKNQGLPHINVHVPIAHNPVQQSIHGNIHTERDFNVK